MGVDRWKRQMLGGGGGEEKTCGQMVKSDPDREGNDCSV